MAFKTEPPATRRAASEIVLLGGWNGSEDSRNTRDLQTKYVLDHWMHISVPVARVVAELAFPAREAT